MNNRPGLGKPARSETPVRRSARRLQREKDFTGDRLTTFRAVFLRHGLPGLILALLCLTAPGLQILFVASVDQALIAPLRTAVWVIVIAAALNIYVWLIDRQWSPAKLGWVAYLGALSLWEEWVFRIALPQSLETWGIEVWAAALLSALVFSSAHYFTLRWKLRWCVGAFTGSLALSRQMEVHDSLLIITAFHWIATTLNTPRPPGQSANDNR